MGCSTRRWWSCSAKLPLAPDMCDALLEHKGPEGELLECLNALEDGDFDKAEGILPRAGQLYISALVWADEVTKPPLGSRRPVGDFGECAHRPPRTTHTNDLSASLRSGGRFLGVGSVLNLCEGGMLVELGSDLEVAEIVGFELVGPVSVASVSPLSRTEGTRRSACALTPGRVLWTARSASSSPHDCADGGPDHTILARRPPDSRRRGVLGRAPSASRSTLRLVTPTRGPGLRRG